MSYMEACPFLHVLNALKGKWKLRILYEIVDHEDSCGEGIRFNDLRRAVGDISSLVLSKSLQELVEDGIVKRVQYNEVPVRVEYSITEAGRGLGVLMDYMGGWGVELFKQQAANERCEGAGAGEGTGAGECAGVGEGTGTSGAPYAP